MHRITLRCNASFASFRCHLRLDFFCLLSSDTKESPFFLPYQHPTIVDMQYVSHVERAVASAMCHASVLIGLLGFDCWVMLGALDLPSFT